MYRMFLELLRKHHLGLWKLDVGIDKLYPYLNLTPYGLLIYDDEGEVRVRLSKEGLIFCDEKGEERINLTTSTRGENVTGLVINGVENNEGASCTPSIILQVADINKPRRDTDSIAGLYINNNDWSGTHCDMSCAIYNHDVDIKLRRDNFGEGEELSENFSLKGFHKGVIKAVNELRNKT